MAKKSDKVIPTTLSGLLEAACDDMATVRKMKSRVLDMDTYCSVYGSKCYVCMAGAVLDRRLGWGGKALKFGDVEGLIVPPWAMAIDEMRKLDFTAAAAWLGLCLHEEVIASLHSLYRDSFMMTTNRHPVRVYRKAVKILREAGF